MIGALGAWLIGAPAGGAVLSAFSVFSGRGGSWLRRLAALGGFGVGGLAALEGFLRSRHGSSLAANLGGWAPPWGVEIRMDVWITLALLALFVSQWIASRGFLPEPESQARRLSLQLLLVSGLAGSLILQDSLARFGFVSLSVLVLAGLLMEDGGRPPAEGVTDPPVRPAFDFFLKASVGQAVLVLGMVLLFAGTGTFHLAGWAARLGSTAPVPGVAAACLLSILGFAILSGAYPAPGWAATAWLDSPTALPARIWFSRWVLWLGAEWIQHLAVSPAGDPASRMWEWSRWAAWAAFALCAPAAFSPSDGRKAWGALDAAGLFFFWGLSNAAQGALAVLAVSQAWALTLGALAPPTHKAAGSWVLRVSVALLLPGWTAFALFSGLRTGRYSWGAWTAVLALTLAALMIAKPLPAEEATASASERGFLLSWASVLAGFFLLLFLI